MRLEVSPLRSGSRPRALVALLCLLAACSSTDLRPGMDARSRELSGRNLSKMDLGGVNFAAAHMTKSELSSANLARAHLAWADLVGANLSHADLSWASLERADLRDARLVGAKLEQALFTGAHLCGADLTSVTGVTSLQLSRAHCWDERTRWPEGIELQPAAQPHDR